MRSRIVPAVAGSEGERYWVGFVEGSVIKSKPTQTKQLKSMAMTTKNPIGILIPLSCCRYSYKNILLSTSFDSSILGKITGTIKTGFTGVLQIKLSRILNKKKSLPGKVKAITLKV